MLEPGSVLEVRYKIIKTLNKNDVSFVYLGKHLNLKKPVVIREVDGSSLVSATREMIGPIFTEKSRTYAKLNHPSIPKILDFFPLNEFFYLVFEFVEGKTLKSLMGERGSNPLSEKEILNYAIKICKPLWFLHNQKPNPIVLGNLNPRNIMVDSDKNVFILNLSIKRYIMGSSHGCKTGYTAPEGYRSQFIPGSDIFSFGNILYYLATGLDPGSGKTDYGLPSVETLNPKISEELRNIIVKASDPEASLRFKNIKELKDTLKNTLKVIEKKEEEEKKRREEVGAEKGEKDALPEEYRPEEYKSKMEKAMESALKNKSPKISKITKQLERSAPLPASDSDEPLFELDSDLNSDPFEKVAADRARKKEKRI